MSERVLLDTQILILGYNEPESDEGQVLRDRQDTILLLSSALEDQIRRVARRVRNKDWAGLLINRIWHEFTVEYVVLPTNPSSLAYELAASIPREDILIFLTALLGDTTLFISGNRKFIRAAAAKQQLFTCLTPKEFLILEL